MGCGASKPAVLGKQERSSTNQNGWLEQWRVKLGIEMPNFECETTTGKFNFHDFLGKDPKLPYTLLFSHPKDFTPVCTTELGMCERLVPEFAKRAVKLIGISCDPVEEHKAWSKDIIAREKLGNPEGDLSFPIISDANKALVTMLGMIDPEERDSAGMALPARALVLIGPDRLVKMSILYPATTGRDFDEVLRAIDSIQLTAEHQLATPANWKQGERCVVAPIVSTGLAKSLFENLVQEELPSGKPYLRMVDYPKVPVVIPEAKQPLPPGPIVKPDPPSSSSTSKAWKVKLGAEVPNFPCVATSGPSMFHEMLKDEALPWTVLFTHPKDFTPVCTTELGTCHSLAEEFAKRSIKMIALSCDSVDLHNEWSKDILARCGSDKSELAFPMIADVDKSIVTLLGMLDPAEQDHTGLPLPARALLLIDEEKKIRFSILYPATTGRNFNEVLRAVDSVMLTAKFRLATPVNWKQGERCVVAPVVPTEEAKASFQNFVQEELPSGKPYLRMVDCPAAQAAVVEPAQANEVPPLVDAGGADGKVVDKFVEQPVDVEGPAEDSGGGSGGGIFACCA